VLLAVPLVVRVADRVSVLTAGRITARLDGAGFRADPAALLTALAPRAAEADPAGPLLTLFLDPR
jgi:hypothetical protein